MTTGELQQRVYLGGERRPGRALVLGAEHVSFSAMVTLAHAGADVVALVTDQPRQQSYAGFRLAAAARWRVPVWTSTAIRRVIGRSGLAGVELADLRTGETRVVDCDTLVVTGDWIPDQELARLAGIDIDPGTRGPAVDTALQSCVPDVFAAGNLVHAAETADVAALGGRHAARHLAAALRDPRAAGARRVPVTPRHRSAGSRPMRSACRRCRRRGAGSCCARRLPAARTAGGAPGRAAAGDRAGQPGAHPAGPAGGRLAAPGGSVRRPGARAARLAPASPRGAQR